MTIPEITMNLAATTYHHISLDSDGEAVVTDSNTKVSQIVGEIQAHGLSPEELCWQLPHLSLSGVHSALAYYWDHRDQIDREIERRHQKAETIRLELGQPPVVERLRRLKAQRGH